MNSLIANKFYSSTDYTSCMLGPKTARTKTTRTTFWR